MPKKTIRSKPKKLRTQKKPRRLNVFAIVAIVSILAGIFLFQLYRSLSSPLKIAEVANNSGTVNLSLNPADNSLALNEETLVTLTYDVLPGDGMSSVKAEISFDPTVIAVSNIVISDKFPTQLASKKVTNDKITFTYGVGAPEEPDFVSTLVTGQGTLATFKAKALKAGSSTFAITASTLTLTKNGGNNNSLREISNTTITVADPSASPSTNPSTAPSANPSATQSTTPSTAPSTTPSTSPSTTPSTTPSVAPSQSPDASIPAAQKPAAPSNLVYNCYDGGKRITLRWNAVSNASSYEVKFDQKDGSDDQTKTATRAEIDLDIKNNTTYDWQVVSIKNGVKSDASSVGDIKCSGDVAQAATPTPTPSTALTPTPTPAPTKTPITQQIANIFKPKSPSPTPTPKPTLTPTDYAAPNQNSAMLISPTPTPTPGSLSDIFATPSESPIASANSKNESLISKIFLGWQALFIRLIESITK
ncbi:MAG: hypothetical protein E6P95_00785 [Candidatus Moraniibacteriota bacterium]|nr:MAG: hypothetical protein E6P95_00785 [Candidatus Moranbacteria bacterium]